MDTRHRGVSRGTGARGHTLVELTVALGVVATLAGAAVPSLSAVRAHLLVGEAAHAVAVELHRTRMRAVAENALCRLVFDPAGTYVRQCSSDGVTWVSEAAQGALPANVHLLSSVGATPLTFGGPDSTEGALAAPTFTRLGTVTAETTITLRNVRGEQQVIHVNALGRVTIS